MDASQSLQMVVSVVGNWTLVIQLRTEREPRKETTMSEFVESVATKPVASVLRVLGVWVSLGSVEVKALGKGGFAVFRFMHS